MMQIRLSLNLSFVLLTFIVAACARVSPAAPVTDLPAATSATGTLPATPAPTSVLSPTRPPSPTPEVKTGPEFIVPANAGRVAGLTKLGKGTIQADSVWGLERRPVFSPDGLWMAVPTSAGIYLYDAITLEEQCRIPAGGASIFSPDGGLLAASGRGAISLWDPASGYQVGKLPGNPEGYYRGLVFSPDGALLAMGSWNREITVWSLEHNESLFTFPGDRLQFSPDGELAVVVVYGENQVHLYETRGGAEVNKWNVHLAGFAPGGQLWLEDEGSVRLAYIDRDLLSPPFSGVQPSFSADGRLIALFADRQISLYDHQQGRRVQILEGNYEQIDGVLFSPDGQTLAGEVVTLHCPTCTEIDGLDSYLVLWRAVDGAIIAKLEQQGQSSWLGYSVDGSLLAAVQNGNVQIVKAADGSIVDQIDGFTAPVVGMALAPDGKTLAAVHATDPYTLRLWDLENGQVARVLPNQQFLNLSYVEVAYSLDEKYIAVGGDIWDLAAGSRLTRTEQAIGEKTSCWASSVAFSPRENTLATGCFEGQLDLWSVPDGTLRESFGGYSSWVNELAYSPDGEHLAAIYNVPDYLVQVWQLPEGAASFTLTGGHFTRVAYSADGRILATVMANPEYDQYGWPAGFVQLWSATDGAELARLEIEDAVSIAFSPDGQILATGSLDGTLRLWDIAGGRMLLEASGQHYQQIERLVFTPDGASLVSGSQDGTILRWGIPGLSSP
jgi:WD40 repeat protein